MPLPSDQTKEWPPADTAREYDKMAEWAAWYSGDTTRLSEIYAGYGVMSPEHTGKRSFWSRFHSRANDAQGPQKAKMHVPVAGDLASMSGALLFGEEPRIRIAEAHETGRTDPSAKASEERLQEIIIEGGVYNRLVEAAETAAAMGGVYLRPVWDEDLAPFPILAVTQADQAVPTFKWGILHEVVFWRVLEEDGNIITRHLEWHHKVPGENAVIEHAVYQGNRTQIGERLSDEVLQALTGLDPVVELPFEDLDVEYIPNMRPNRLWRSSALGLSDYSGAEMVFDSIDEAYASWMRDIRLAKARIIVPREYLDTDGNFDVDHEIYTPVDMIPEAAESGGARAMLAHQFAIRFEEHRETVIEFLERAVSNAGYSPQTFGFRIQGRAESGTALRIRENKTLLTMKRKGHWWGPAISQLMEHLLIIDMTVFGSSIEVFRPTTELSDSIANDNAETAKTVLALKQAQAASTEARVRIAQPGLSEEEVQAEAKRIMEEEGIGESAPDPFTAFGGQMVDEQDASTAEEGDQAEAEEGQPDAAG